MASRKPKTTRKKYGNPARQAQYEAQVARRDNRTAQPRSQPADPSPSTYPTPGTSLFDLPRFRRPHTAAWFHPGLDTLREGADTLRSAAGPLALTEAVACLVGQVFHDAIGGDNWDLYFEEFVDHAANTLLDELDTTTEDPDPRARLVYGLVAMQPDGALSEEFRDHLWGRLRQVATTAAGTGAASAAQPLAPWLLEPPSYTASGRLWELIDVYGGARRGVVAQVTGEQEAGFYVWDTDLCVMPEIVNAGLYGDLDTAVAAWRAWVGPAGASSDAVPATAVDPILIHRDPHIGARGDETRPALNHWVLAERMACLVDQLAGQLGAEERPKARESWQAEGERFVAWLAERNGPLDDDARGLAMQAAEMWCQVTPPASWPVVSPHRIAGLLAAIQDMFTDEWAPRVAAQLPDLIRFQAERGAATPEQVTRALAIAAGTDERKQQDCPGTSMDLLA